MVSKLKKIWSGLFIPDPGCGCRLFTHPRSRIQGSKRHRIPDPDPQHWVLIKLNRWEEFDFDVVKNKNKIAWCTWLVYMYLFMTGVGGCSVNNVDVRSCTHQEAVLALLQPCDVMLLKVKTHLCSTIFCGSTGDIRPCGKKARVG
jgi:hypothetical protein